MTSPTPTFLTPLTLILLCLQLSTTFSSRSLSSDNKKCLDGHISSSTNKYFGLFHPNEHFFKLLTEHSLVQKSVGFNAVGTWNQFLHSTFTQILSTLFCTQTFHSLCTFRIQHNTICESIQQNALTISTSLFTAVFIDTINLLNEKDTNNLT